MRLITRRHALKSSLAFAAGASSLSACNAALGAEAKTTKVHVMGVIHRNHRTSETYSLKVLEAAIRKAQPDLILTEIPHDRLSKAVRSFRETGVVQERRTQAFPEYTDVVFPLSREMDFRLKGTAGWTRKIAIERSAALERIQNDPARAQQWAEYMAARRTFSRKLAGRGDDPLFIHTAEFDTLVEASRAPYEKHFDADLGLGGWRQINEAHNVLINAALDTVTGLGLSALVTYGSAHKYKILRSLERRDDAELLNTRELFLP